MTTRRWTQSALDELRARNARGETAVEIAAALSRAPHEVADIARRLRLRPVAIAQAPH